MVGREANDHGDLQSNRKDPHMTTTSLLPTPAATPPAGPVDYLGIPYFPDIKSFQVDPIPDLVLRDLTYLIFELLGTDFGADVMDLAEMPPGLKRDAAWLGVQWRLLRAAARLARQKSRERAARAEAAGRGDEDPERFDGLG